MPTVEAAHKALHDIVEILLSLQVVYYLDGGTLLGFYRDGTFCEDDHDDIDLTVSAENWGKVKEIIKKAYEAGFELYHEWPRDTERHRSGQLAFKRDNVKVDIMFKETKRLSDRVWWTVYGGPKGVTYKATPAEFTRVKVGKAGGYLMPKEADLYLEYRYGDWKIPVHRREYSCYTTDKSIIKDNTYEAI